MTQTGFSNAIVDTMLGWLKGLATWVLRLFNLSGGISPLKFLANNWLKLLIFFLILGVAVDVLVWLLRWRPHWVWFRKKRVIINDKDFFKRAEAEEAARQRPVTNRPLRPKRDWEESEFVVPGAQRRRREEMERRELERRKARAAQVKSMQLGAAQAGENTDVFTDGLFNVNAKQKFSDKYEDEVFSVSNLPRPEGEAKQKEEGARPRRSGAKKPVRRPEQRPGQRSAQRPQQRSGRADMTRSQRRPRPEKRS